MHKKFVLSAQWLCRKGFWVTHWRWWYNKTSKRTNVFGSDFTIGESYLFAWIFGKSLFCTVSHFFCAERAFSQNKPIQAKWLAICQYRWRDATFECSNNKIKILSYACCITFGCIKTFNLKVRQLIHWFPPTRHLNSSA